MAKKVKVRVSFTQVCKHTKIVEMTRKELSELEQRLDDGDLDELDAFDNFGFSMADPTDYEDPILEDLHEVTATDLKVRA